MSDYRKYEKVLKVERGYHSFRMFLKLECGHEVYRYQKTPPAKVLCEYCHRNNWFPPVSENVRTCQHCHGEHEPDTSDIWVEWNGQKYFSPFICLCCGKETCARQWAYGRCCGICDTGLCQKDPKYYHAPYKTDPITRAWSSEEEEKAWAFLQRRTDRTVSNG